MVEGGSSPSAGTPPPFGFPPSGGFPGAAGAAAGGNGVSPAAAAQPGEHEGDTRCMSRCCGLKGSGRQVQGR